MNAKINCLLAGATGVLLFVLGCGGSANLNRLLFVDSEDEKRVDNLLARAQIAYDSGEFEEALTLLEDAKQKVPESEKLIQLEAFTHMALGGFDPLPLIQKIVDKTENKKAVSDTANILSMLSDVLELKEEDLRLLGEPNDLSDNPILKGLKVYLPDHPGSHLTDGEPRNTVGSLRRLNTAISTICPLISEELLQTDGVITMDRYRCKKVAGSQKNQAQSYLLFSLAHLTETLIFNTILLYSSGSSPESHDVQIRSNLFQRLIKVEEAGKSGPNLESIPDYTEAVTQVVSDVASVFNTSSGSMLAETMSNLRKTVSAFRYIEGIPESFTRQIQQALDKIEETARQAGATIGNLSGETDILAQKLGSKIVAKLNAQVDRFFKRVDNIKDAQGGNLTECQAYQISAMCDAVEGLSSIGASLPSASCSYFKGARDPGNCGG